MLWQHEEAGIPPAAGAAQVRATAEAIAAAGATSIILKDTTNIRLSLDQLIKQAPVQALVLVFVEIFRLIAGESNDDRGAFPDGAVDVDQAVMALHDLFDDGQSQARAFALELDPALTRFIKWIKHIFQIFFLDADAAVFNFKINEFIFGGYRNRHLSVVRRVVNGVLDEIDRKLLDGHDIAHDQTRIGIEQPKIDIFLFSESLRSFGDAGDQL